MKEMWLAILVSICVIIVLGCVFSVCIFIKQIWIHINQQPTIINAESVIITPKNGEVLLDGNITLNGPISIEDNKFSK